ncbi:MaoC family dehydratase [Ahrensia sp. R2A130]|uniref:MaoC family dehydratase n=1 Tax=Ahrensia sp. R2A130 TaxID=744979 RepID=UPI0001E0D167|nr:MaoC family dehydratase [Ahrensia sp. R2A130]EFL87704.1 nodulation protein N [Ahrensia sp. R2A130]
MGDRSFKDMGALAEGTELGASGWTTISQEMINSFAETTGDKQWIHIDVERAQKESPFGGPIAHGYLTLSLLAPMSYDIGAAPEGAAAAINYGSDKLRFLAPVPAGSKVRAHQSFVSFEDKGNRMYLMTVENKVEIEGSDKPALIARSLTMFVAGPTAEV